MIRLLLVGLGGFVGSSFRYLLSGAVHRLPGTGTFPYGTFAVNVLGCVLIGFLGGLVESRGLFSGEARLFLLVGVLGGFTTFSTFGYETFQLLRDGESVPALLNVLLHVGLAVAGVWGGYILSRLL